MTELDLKKLVPSFEDGDTPGEFILNPETGFEMVFRIIGCFGIMFFIAAVITSIEKGLIQWWLGGGALILTVIGLGIRANIEDFYVFDFNNKELIFARQIFGSTKRTKLATFDEIDNVAVHGTKHHNKGNVWWTYEVTLVVKSQIIVVHDIEKGGFESAKEQATGLANCLKVPLFEPLEERALVIKNHKPEYLDQGMHRNNYIAKYIIGGVLVFIFVGALAVVLQQVLR